MRAILLSVLTLLSCSLFSQQITVDTSWTSDVPGEVEQYWFWASGVTVNGEGFAPSSEITVYSEDPEGFSWRDFTVNSDANGNFSAVVNAMKIRSVLGVHTAFAADGSGNEASATFNVVANADEVLEVSLSVDEITASDFYYNTGVVVTIGNLTPNGEVKINLGDPSANGMEVEPNEEKFADSNGEYTFTLDQSTQVGIPAQTYSIPQIEGMWSVSAIDFSGTNHNGSANFRMLPDGSGYYCIPSIMYETQPISYVEFSDMTKSSELNSTEGYEDFTAETANVDAGEFYTLKVQGKAQWSFNVNTYTAFIDWNQNGILDEVGEVYSLGFLTGSTGEDGMQVEYDITIPETALNGETRMRILKVNSPSTTALFWPEGACGYYGYGQIEDYTLSISGGIETPECTIVCPEDIAVQVESGAETAVVDYEVSFDCDNSEGVELVLTEGLESGAEFPIGTTTVTHNLVFNGEILDTCTFDVNVEEFMNVSDLDNSTVSVYPNPVKDILTISSDVEVQNVFIYDLSGKQVYSEGVNNKHTQLNLSHLATGIYVLKAETKEVVKTFKIVKK